MNLDAQHRKMRLMSAPTPDAMAKAGTEHAHQCALFCWAASPETKANYPELRWMFAIPNGGERNPKVASQMKSEGVKAGVLDIFLPVPKGRLHGLFIEMKVGNNKPSDLQLEFANFVAGEGYLCCLCYSWNEARMQIEKYLALPCISS